SVPPAAAPVPAGVPAVPGSVPPAVAPVPAGAPVVPGSVPPVVAPVPAGAPAVPGSVPPVVAPPVLKGKKKKAKKEKKRAEVEAAAPSAPAAAPPAIETPVVSSGGVVDLEPEAGVEGESLRQAPELPDFAEKFISGATYTNHQNYKFPIESRNFSANGKKYESITVLVGEGDFQEELAVSLKNARSFRKGSNAASSLKVYLDGQKSRFDALNAVNGVEVKIESGVAKLAIDRHQYPLDLDTGNVDLSSFENSSVDSIRLTSENAEKLKRVLDSLRAKHKLLEDIPSDFKSSFVIVPNLETGRAKMHYSYEAGRMVEVQNSTNTGILLDGFSGTGNGFNFDRGKEAFDVAVKKLAQGEGVVDNLSEGNKTNYLALREDQYSIAERLLSDSDSATGLSYELGGKKHEVIEFYGTGGGTNIKIAVAKAEVEGEVMYGKIIDSSTKRNAGLIDAAIEGVETDSFDLSTQLRGYLKAKGAIAPELRNLLNFNKNRDGIEISEKPGGTKYKVKFVKIGADYKMKVQSSGKWTDEMILDKELNVEKLKGEILTAENN
ncbi:hypothetical protein HOH67_00070, partial [Candidatus Peregrinibacteria bacterium]|nr:hypothetical protein [Candidatus Peregrinibacteria bacterium]